jgi:transaldolase
MTILIDSGIPDEVRQAANWGWVKGVTTNPTLLAQSPLSPRATLLALAEAISGPVFYQLVQREYAAMLDEAAQAYELLGERLVVKIPAVPLGFQAAAHLSPDIPCCITAMYSPGQAIAALESGASYAVVYYDRMLRLMPQADEALENIVRVLKHSQTSLLGASIKSVEQIITAHAAGIQKFTLPLDVLSNLSIHELSEAAVASYNQHGAGIDL